MLGAIIGDIAGSVYEFHPHKSKDFPLFSEKSAFTDDTVMTLAVAEALMNGGAEEDYIASMQRWGRRYPDGGYGGRFFGWLFQKEPQPYNSFGNGSAMRVSPVAWFYDSLEAVENAAALSARVTHNHPEGIKGAQATAAAVFLARTGHGKREVRSYLSARFGYDLSRTCGEIRPGYHFDVTCQGSVPEAIIAWLDSDGFEDAIRNAVSLGGDSDTQAAVAGAIAQAEYGIPPEIAREAYRRLDAPLQTLADDFFLRVMKPKYRR